MNILISVLNGRLKGRKYPVAEGKSVKIGRGSAADVVIVDSMSSRIHCEITNHGTQFILKDLDSSNGTYKDDEPIKQVSVHSGDRFKIGTTIFEIRGVAGPIDDHMAEEPVVAVEKSGVAKTGIIQNPDRLEDEDRKKTVIRRDGPKPETKGYTLGEFENLVSNIEAMDEEGEEEDLPPITVIASGKEAEPAVEDEELPPVEVVESGSAPEKSPESDGLPPVEVVESSKESDDLPPVEVVESGKAEEADLEELPPIEVVSSGKEAVEAVDAGPEERTSGTVESDDETESEDSALSAVTDESTGTSETEAEESDEASEPVQPYSNESAELPSIPVIEPMSSPAPVVPEPVIEVKTSYPEYGKEIPDPKLDSEPMKSPDTVTEDAGLMMVEPGKTRDVPPDEFMEALDAIPDEEPEELRKKVEPEAEEEVEDKVEIPDLEEAPPPPVSEAFDPIPQDFQIPQSEPMPELEEVPGMEKEEEEEEKPAGDRITVEFRKTVESADDGEEESSLAILEPVPGFEYEDDLLCIRCGNLMEQKDIDGGLAQKEGYGYVCPTCVRTETDGQMSGLGFGNLEVVDVGTIDDELLEEMKKEGTDVAEMLDEALRSQKDE
ncbi:MAG: FHA domain-containing protein [Planctomycetota bacterium]|jgi:pSer/pThr/pTyr-binding forkhead associated (FHA) protein|nr:FHA domain-containing protein [Planctomycetota bacterium]MDP7129797.1 FHA domain-containing protein [Planctomycetota bacterium]MDP7248254.1 FHA domain-containing protein [Planctomycetota bacterium]